MYKSRLLLISVIMNGVEKQKKSDWLKDSIIKAGQLDREAFEMLYAKYLTPIYRYFVIRTLDKALSEDLAHSVFLKAWDNSDKLNDADKALSWLFVIARNTLIDYWRKKKEILVDDIELLENAGETEDISEEHENKQRIEKINSVLSKLSEDQKEIILMKFFEGLTNEEICAITKKSSIAIRALQYRALTSLKKILEDETQKF